MPKIEKIQVEFEGRWHEEEVIVEEDQLAPWGDEEHLEIVGKGVPRVDGFERVSGRAMYTCDVRLPGMLHGKILRSPHPNARIVRIDTDRAESYDGVVAVMTHVNAPPLKFDSERDLFDRHLLYEGDEVAAVVAEDEQIASDALLLIDVEYEILPHVIDPIAAMASDAPKLHPNGNVHADPAGIYQRGNLEEGLADADVVVEAVYRTPVALHNAMETHGSVAHWVDGDLTVWDSTQGVFQIRDRLAESLGIPRHRVRVIKQYVGGAFGAKLDMGKYTLMAAAFSRKTGRPVRFLLDRAEENLATGNRPSAVVECKAGATRDGRLTALYARSVSAIGAHGTGGSSVCGPFREMYLCPNVQTEQISVNTNTGPSCAFRAPGYVEGTFALECLMDELAEALRMDPLELRLANYAEQNQSRNRPYTSKHLRAAYEHGAHKIGWSRRRNAGQPQKGRFRRGIGMASQVWGGGGTPPSYAMVKVNSDASVDVITGTQDIGTGTRTVLAQIAAEELGVPLESVRVHLGDTAAGPYSISSGGSATLASVGPAVRSAANDARRQLLDLAEYMLDVPLEKLSINKGTVHSLEGDSKELPLSEVAAKMGNYMIIGKAGRAPNPAKATVNTFGAQFAEVEVDMQTGLVRLINIVGQHDIGRVVNPLTVTSQFEGGVIQGAGIALTEARMVDGPTGKVLNANLEDYKVLTSVDVPVIDVTPVDNPDPVSNNLGVKGAGEPPIIPTAPAIVNAIYDATGLRMRTIPITPKELLEAIREAESTADAERGKG